MMVYSVYVWVNLLGQIYPWCDSVDFAGSSRDKFAVVFHAQTFDPLEVIYEAESK